MSSTKRYSSINRQMNLVIAMFALILNVPVNNFKSCLDIDCSVCVNVLA